MPSDPIPQTRVTCACYPCNEPVDAGWPMCGHHREMQSHMSTRLVNGMTGEVDPIREWRYPNYHAMRVVGAFALTLALACMSLTAAATNRREQALAFAIGGCITLFYLLVEWSNG